MRLNEAKNPLDSKTQSYSLSWELSDLSYRIFRTAISENQEAWQKSRRDDRPQTGVKPPVVVRQQKKPRRGDRDRCKLILNKLDILSPLLGFCFVDAPVPGVYTPVCALSHLWCFLPDNNNCFPPNKHQRCERAFMRPLSPYEEESHPNNSDGTLRFLCPLARGMTSLSQRRFTA